MALKAQYKEFMHFEKGLVTNIKPTMMEPSQLAVCNNADLDKIGIVKAILGWTEHREYAYNLDDIFWQNLFATSGIIARAGTVLYDREKIITVEIEDAELVFKPFGPWLLMVNGTKNYKFRQDGITLNWHSSYSYAWESSYLRKTLFPYANRLNFYTTNDLTKACTQEWEAETLNGISASDFTTGEYFLTSSEAQTSTMIAAAEVLTRRSIVELGIAAPTENCSVATGAAGSLTGTYRYYITYENNYAYESNPSPVSSNVSPSLKKVNLTDIPISDDPQVVKRNIYRNENGEVDYYLVDTIEDNHTTTFTDNVADTSLGRDMPTTNDKPDGADSIEEHLGLVFLLDDVTIKWSSLEGYFEYFDPTNYENMGSSAQTGLMIMALGEELDMLSDTEIWRRVRNQQGDEEKKKSLSDKGAVSKKGISHRGDVILFVATSGLYAFDTVRDKPLSEVVDDLFSVKSTRADRLNKNAASAVASLYQDDVWLVAYPIPKSEENGKVLYYDTAIKAFSLVDLSGVVDFAGDKRLNDVYFAKGKKIYKMWNGLVREDTGEDISFEIKTKDFAGELGGLGVGKTFGDLIIYGNPKSGTLTVTAYVDDSAEGSWSFNADGEEVWKKTNKLDKWGYRFALKVEGTRDAEFYGFGLVAELEDV